MSLNFIRSFQVKLFSILNESAEIKKYIKKVYLSVIQDGNCPFVVVEIIKIGNLSKFDNNVYEIEFEISIFNKDKNQNILILIANLTEQEIQQSSEYFDDYLIAGIKLNKISFGQAKDLVTNKLVMEYKALIKNRGIK